MFATYKNIRIAGVSAAVPANKERITDLISVAPKEVAFKLKRVAALAGLEERHVAPCGMTVSDIAVVAGRDLLQRLGWSCESIDMLFFVTQTPEYFLPANGYSIHNSLGLSPRCVVTDMTASCSGMVQGIWAACGHFSQTAQQPVRALVLAGDTMSKTFVKGDWGNKVLFGDAVGAMALESSPSCSDFISFFLESYPDVSGALTLYGSGYKSDLDKEIGFYMDGAQIMDFSQRKVPLCLEKLMHHVGCARDAVDAFFFHQPNSAILDGIISGMKIEHAKVPRSIATYGNCSNASIPVVMCHNSSSFSSNRIRSILCGFGGGLAVASAYAELEPRSFGPILCVE